MILWEPNYPPKYNSKLRLKQFLLFPRRMKTGEIRWLEFAVFNYVWDKQVRPFEPYEGWHLDYVEAYHPDKCNNLGVVMW
jgi:hypothetical protein